MRQIDQNSPENNWAKIAIQQDNSLDDYNAHLATVEYTQEEMAALKKQNMFTGNAIWGKPHIEGRILASKFDLILHVVELHQLASPNSKKITEIFSAHMLITKEGVKQVEEEDAFKENSKKIVHLAVYKDHFVPILFNPSLEKKLQQTSNADKQDSRSSNQSPRFFWQSQVNINNQTSKTPVLAEQTPKQPIQPSAARTLPAISNLLMPPPASVRSNKNPRREEICETLLSEKKIN